MLLILLVMTIAGRSPTFPSGWMGKDLTGYSGLCDEDTKSATCTKSLSDSSVSWVPLGISSQLFLKASMKIQNTRDKDNNSARVLAA